MTTVLSQSNDYRVTTVLSQRRCPDRFGLRRQRNSMRTLGKHSDNTAQRALKFACLCRPYVVVWKDLSSGLLFRGRLCVGRFCGAVLMQVLRT